MIIAVAGAGYVGMSLAVLLAQRHTVHLVDIDPSRIALIQGGASPVADEKITALLAAGNLDLHPTLDAAKAYEASDMAIVAVPTDYDPNLNFFDTSAVDDVVRQAAEANPSTTIVVRSTTPVGHTDKLAARFPKASILFSPEFLREGRSLHDNLYPSRIVVGAPSGSGNAGLEQARHFASLLTSGAAIDDVPVTITKAAEAEAIKLFSNTYLALRIAFFNELDTYADLCNLDVRSIVEGVCADPRIGDFYNNPSFGYGGYCLPKDTKQLLANYQDVPQDLIGAVISANETRKGHIANRIAERLEQEQCRPEGGDAPGALKNGAAVVGIYRLAMKAGSDNIRSSSVVDVMQRLMERGFALLVYAPLFGETEFLGCEVTHSLDEFKQRSTLIVANRVTSDLSDVSDKVFTRDLFSRD